MTIYDFVEQNGKTIRQNNLEKQHDIPLGTLVEAKWDSWYGDGACIKFHGRLWVVEHTRDCDGTPLYTLSVRQSVVTPLQFLGFSREDLTPIELTQSIRDGEDALEWEDEDDA